MSAQIKQNIIRNKTINLKTYVELTSENSQFYFPHQEITSWNTQKDGSGQTYTETINIGDDTIIYAQWGAERLNVEYCSNFQSIADGTLTLSPESYNEEGKKGVEKTFTPQETLKIGDKTLVLGEDYIKEYINNTVTPTTQVTAQCSLSGINNYGGTIKSDFSITYYAPREVYITEINNNTRHTIFFAKYISSEKFTLWVVRPYGSMKNFSLEVGDYQTNLITYPISIKNGQLWVSQTWGLTVKKSLKADLSGDWSIIYDGGYMLSHPLEDETVYVSGFTITEFEDYGHFVYYSTGDIYGKLCSLNSNDFEPIGNYVSDPTTIIKINIADEFVYNIQDNAFEGCTQMKVFTAGYGKFLSSMGNYTFKNCNNLLSVFLSGIEEAPKVYSETFQNIDHRVSCFISSSMLQNYLYHDEDHCWDTLCANEIIDLICV